jgi:lactate permease
MWQQIYTPIAGNTFLSAAVAAIPIFTLIYALGIGRMPSWKASLIGMVSAELLAVVVYGMPIVQSLSSLAYGAAFGLFPIGWVVYWAIVLYRFTVDTGKFEIVKDSIGSVTTDSHVQALLIAFGFGAFIEGASGFGTPVAVAGAMLAGLGFPPFYAAAICLLANTAPVAFGSIGIPIVTLSGVTGLPLQTLSSDVGRICAPVSLIIPSYLIMVMGGWRALKAVFPATFVCGFAFAGTQLLVSNTLGPALAAIMGSVASIIALIILLRFWKPKEIIEAEVHRPNAAAIPRHPTGEVVTAWVPYSLLVAFVLLWGISPVKNRLNAFTIPIRWPGLHNQIMRMPPAVAEASPYAAVYTLNWLTAAGTACMFAALLSTLFLRIPPRRALRLLVTTGKQLLLPLMTIASVLALAFLMNYCGATATLGLAFAATSVFFPFFSSLLGWLGVFLTGSDTSSNALFGNLQGVTAIRLGLNPAVMAASNSSGGVMGKMISLQSIAVAAAATEMKPADEGKLFRFTLGPSILLASLIGLTTVIYAYVFPYLVK